MAPEIERVRVSLEARDAGSRELFEHNLKDEEGHVAWIEAKRDQVAQIGIERYLLNQVCEEAARAPVGRQFGRAAAAVEYS